MHGRPVSAVAARGGVSGGFHARQDLARQPAAADGVEGKRGTGRLERAGQLGHEAGGRRIADAAGTSRAEHRFLAWLPHDVHERNLLLDAEPAEHLAKVGGCGCVHQRAVILHPHGLDHAEHRHRVHERGCAFDRRRSGRQLQAQRDVDRPVLRVHPAARRSDDLAQQSLRGRGPARRHDRARALVADRHGRPYPAGQAAHGGIRDRRGDDRAPGGPARHRGGHVSPAEEQAHV